MYPVSTQRALSLRAQVSAVLADDAIMLLIRPGQHGSTYGGNPLGCKVAIEALKVLEEEVGCRHATTQILVQGMYANSERMGALLQNELRRFPSDVVTDVRGKGLMVGVTIAKQYDAWKLVLLLAEHGILTKNTHGDRLRLAPPLCITESQLLHAVEQMHAAVMALQSGSQYKSVEAKAAAVGKH
jgi:ornithine--oxo-acid transaminase